MSKNTVRRNVASREKQTIIVDNVPIEVTDKEKDNALQKKLYMSVWRNKQEDFDKYLSLNADPFFIYHNDRTLLHLACYFGHSELVIVLLGLGLDPNKMDKMNETPTSLAAKNGKLSVINAILYFNKENPTKLVQKIDTSTLIYDAVISGDIELVLFLLKKDSNINLKNSNGFTPLMLAVLNERKMIVSLLHKEGADWGEKNTDNKTALDLMMNIEISWWEQWRTRLKREKVI